jgi:hypothetical protein
MQLGWLYKSGKHTVGVLLLLASLETPPPSTGGASRVVKRGPDKGGDAKLCVQMQYNELRYNGPGKS